MIPWLTLIYNCDSWTKKKGDYTIVLHTLNGFYRLSLLLTAKALSFPYNLPAYPSLLLLCFQNSEIPLLCTPKALNPLFSYPHCPITAIKNIPRNFWHRDHGGTTKQRSSGKSVCSSAAPSGTEAVEEPPRS